MSAGRQPFGVGDGPAAATTGAALDGGMPSAVMVELDEAGTRRLAETGSLLHAADE